MISVDVKCSISGTLSTIGSSCWIADAAEKPPDPKILRISFVIQKYQLQVHYIF